MSAQNWIGGQWQAAQNAEMFDFIYKRFGKTMGQAYMPAPKMLLKQ